MWGVSFGELDGMSAATQLIADLEHEDPRVRAWAAEKLGQERVLEAVAALLRLLSDSEDRVRSAAVDALAEIGDPQAIPAICKCLNERYSSVGYAAHRAVLAFDARAVPRLVEELRQGNWGTHSGVTRAIIAIGSPAVEPLCELLSSPVEQVRQESIQALRSIRDRKAVPRLLGALADESEWIRAQAVQVLHELRDPRAAPALAAALKDPCSKVRHGAAVALCDLGDAGSEEALLHALRDPDDTVRNQVALALGKLGTERSVLPLIGLLREGKYSAVVALHPLAERAPCPALRAALPLLRQAMSQNRSSAVSNAYLPLIERIEEVTALFRDLPVPALPHTGSENLPRVVNRTAALPHSLHDEPVAGRESPFRASMWLRRIRRLRRAWDQQ